MGKSVAILLVLAAFGCTAAARAAAPLASEKQPITSEELFDLFLNEREIEGRQVESRMISEVIRWAQDEAASNHPLPPRGLILRDCDVKGTLNLRDIRTTKVSELPDKLRQHFTPLTDEVRLVPIRLRLLHTTVEYLGLQNTVFQSWFDFGSSTVSGDPAATSVAWLKNTAFSGGAYFGDAVFKTPIDISDCLFDLSGSDSLPEIDFRKVTFEAEADFTGATFVRRPNFTEARFQGPAYFRGVTFAGGGKFDRAAFKNAADFAQAGVIGTLSFMNVAFDGDSFFIDFGKELRALGTPVGGNIVLSGARFSGRLYFRNAAVRYLLFSADPFEIDPHIMEAVNDEQPSGQNTAKLAASEPATERELPTRNPISPVSVAKLADFSKLTCELADFSEVEFHDYADFSQATFSRFVNFSRTTFIVGVNFFGTKFPSTLPGPGAPSGLLADEIRLPRTFNLDWEQVRDQLTVRDVETWARLEEAFRQSGNLEGQNEAMYLRRQSETASSSGWKRAGGIFQEWFWGYGVRPVRLVCWMLVVFTLFTWVYWTQARELALAKSGLRGIWYRLSFAIGFSARTSWKLDYGYQRARTTKFKALTFIHSLIFKLMLLCLLKVLANISPLLNELVGKLLPL